MKEVGIIEKIKLKNKNFSIFLNREWFNAFDIKCEFQEGDKVEIEFEKKGQWNNIKKIQPFSEFEPASEKKEPVSKQVPTLKPAQTSQTPLKIEGKVIEVCVSRNRKTNTGNYCSEDIFASLKDQVLEVKQVEEKLKELNALVEKFLETEVKKLMMRE